MNNNEWIEKLMFTHEVLHESLAPDKPVIVYGAGCNGISALIKLKERGIPVLCLCDADKAKQGRSLSGVPVVSPEALRAYAKETAVLISPEKHVAQIRKSLRDMGFHNLLYCSGHGLAFAKESAIREALLAGSTENLADANKERIDFVRSRLCDDKSKEIFSAVIGASFRGAYADLDKYTEGDQYFPEDIIGLREGGG